MSKTAATSSFYLISFLAWGFSDCQLHLQSLSPAAIAAATAAAAAAAAAMVALPSLLAAASTSAATAPAVVMQLLPVGSTDQCAPAESDVPL
jgi:hypothetical protein